MARLHGGGGPKIGEVTRLGGVTRLSIQSLIWSPHLSCRRDQIKMKDYIDGRVIPTKRVTTPTWGPPPPYKQALSRNRKTEFTTTCTGMECRINK